MSRSRPTFRLMTYKEWIWLNLFVTSICFRITISAEMWQMLFIISSSSSQTQFRLISLCFENLLWKNGKTKFMQNQLFFRLLQANIGRLGPKTTTFCNYNRFKPGPTFSLQLQYMISWPGLYFTTITTIRPTCVDIKCSWTILCEGDVGGTFLNIFRALCHGGQIRVFRLPRKKRLRNASLSTKCICWRLTWALNM